MKKLLFGLIATVMLSVSSFGQDASKIVADLNWQIIVKNNVKLLDLIINSNVDIRDKKLVLSDAFYDKIGLNKLDALKLLDQSKLASKKLNSTYFSNVEACSNCAFDTDAKWELFASKIELFRKDRLAYQSFLDTIGYSSINSKINCNNWRMYLCGGGCVLTCEVPPVFAGCLMMCAASFC